MRENDQWDVMRASLGLRGSAAAEALDRVLEDARDRSLEMLIAAGFEADAQASDDENVTRAIEWCRAAPRSYLAHSAVSTLAALVELMQVPIRDDPAGHVWLAMNLATEHLLSHQARRGLFWHAGSDTSRRNDQSLRMADLNKATGEIWQTEARAMAFEMWAVDATTPNTTVEKALREKLGPVLVGTRQVLKKLSEWRRDFAAG